MLEVLLPDARETWLRTSLTRFQDGLVVRLQDISPSKRSERERDSLLVQEHTGRLEAEALARQRAGELNAARERLVQTERLSVAGQLAAGVGHELNNPLAFVTGNLHVAREQLSGVARELGAPVAERLRETMQALEDARRGVERIRTIVKELRTLARTDDTRLGPVDVHAALEFSVSLAMPHLRHRTRVERHYGAVPKVRAAEARHINVGRGRGARLYRRCMEALERFFHIRERGSSVGTELRAGLVTFLTMAYILLVNPQILSEAGMPVAEVTVATALGAAFGTLLMGLYANFPFALAPGMGLNAYFTYGVVKGLGVDWRFALTAVFVEGLLFIVLSYGGVRTVILRAIPAPIKMATTTGIGLFLALIGLRNAGLVADSPATLVQLGVLHAPVPLLALAGLVIIGVLSSRKVQGSLLIGIAAVAVAAWGLGLAKAPQAWVSVPSLPRETFWAFDFSQVLTGKFLTVMLAFLFVDVFDTAGTLLGVGRVGGFLKPNGELPGAGRGFMADAVGTVAGAVFGTSTVTCYIESAAGVEEGGRTGLTAVVVSVLFLLSLFFVPTLAAIPPVATAPVLVVVGALMMSGARELEWNRMDDALPAFLTIALMPFTYSIANGISAGIVSYAALKLLSGRPREAHPVVYVLAVLLVLHYATGGGA